MNFIHDITDPLGTFTNINPHARHDTVTPIAHHLLEDHHPIRETPTHQTLDHNRRTGGEPTLSHPHTAADRAATVISPDEYVDRLLD
ncbi:MAG: hypothetical protein J2P20_13635, partial [Pseudonocardia sp.]|nr:hypothetical protein [Pseudonocardia sp.]